MHPSSAEYWHIGAITIRLGSWRAPTSIGEKSADMDGQMGRGRSRYKAATPQPRLCTRQT